MIREQDKESLMDCQEICSVEHPGRLARAVMRVLAWVEDAGRACLGEYRGIAVDGPKEAWGVYDEFLEDKGRGR